MIRAIPVYIYRDKIIGECSNGGISAKYDEAFLVCDEGQCRFDPDDPPENLIVIGTIRGHKFAQPYRETDPGHVGWMAGGALIYSCDSRFRRMSEYPLSLHDRQETQRTYDILSR